MLSVCVWSYAADGLQERVTFNPVSPWVNGKVSVTYNSKGSDLEYSDEVKAVFYVMNQFKWNVVQLPMVKQNENWKVDLALPANTSFVAVKFLQGTFDNPDIVDNNNGKGYYFPVLSENGKAQPGNALGLAMLMAPTTAGGTLYSYYSTPPVPQKDKIKALLNEESKISGSDKAAYTQIYLGLQRIALGDEFADFSKKWVAKELAKKNLSEAYLDDLYLFYTFSQRDSILGKEVGDRVLKDYPKSNTARFVSYAKVQAQSPNINERISSIEGFLNQYPVSEWRKHPDERSFMYYSLYRVLGADYFDSKQLDKFVGLYKDLDFKTGNELARWSFEKAYAFKTLGQDSLYQVYSQVIPYLIARQDDQSYTEDFPDSEEMVRSNAVKQLDERLATYISLLYDLGKYDEARQNFFKLSDKGRYASATLNEVNLHVLEKLGLKNEILPHLEMCAKYNAVTPGMINKLKEIYVGKQGNDAGFDKYLASLKSEEGKDELKKFVEESMVDYPMPDFELEGADGKMVSSEQLKGKIVLMDFWATWCRPCIMAFPGMQLITDKYAHDPLVKVYIVGTMQTGDYKTKSVNFIKESGYRLNMLHDAVNPKTGEQNLLFRKLAPLFNSSGIPRKIIIKDGRIRYSSEGYSGSPSKLLDEISLAIETLKKDK